MSKLHSGTSKTKAGALFWKSHSAICSPVYVILYHVTGSCKGPIHLPQVTGQEILCKFAVSVVVYAVTSHTTVPFQQRLLVAKLRIAPKDQSISRLEIVAASTLNREPKEL